MTIKIMLESNLKRIFNKEYIQLSFNEISILKLVEELFNFKDENTGENILINFVKDIDEFFSNILILVNGIEISALEGRNTIIKDGDIITLLPIIHGG